MLVGNTWRKRIEKKLLMQFLDVGYIPVLRLPSFSSTFVTQGPNTVRTNLVGSYEPSRWRTAADRGGPRTEALLPPQLGDAAQRRTAERPVSPCGGCSTLGKSQREAKRKSKETNEWFLVSVVSQYSRCWCFLLAWKRKMVFGISGRSTTICLGRRESLT